MVGNSRHPCRERRAWRHSTRAVICHVLVLLVNVVRPVSAEDCCAGPAATIDCSSGAEYKGQYYHCLRMDNARMRACSSCIQPKLVDVVCSSCCGTETTDCDWDWSWGAIISTLSVSAIFATCSGILAFAEKRRKRKGISLATAWSLPRGMPVLRATVVDLSDAVLRRRSSTWSAGGTHGDVVGEGDELEQVGLLAEVANDSLYGALVEQGDANIPVAKLAEDSWVTAMAWRRETPDPASYEYGRRGGEESAPVSPPAASMSRWRSARATARQARRAAAAATAHRDLGSTEVHDGPVWPLDAEQEVVVSSSFRGRVSAVANSGLASPVAPSFPSSREPS